MMLAQKSKNRDLREQIISLKEQRDKSLSMLVETQSEVIRLTLENQRLKSQIPVVNATRLK